MVLTMRNSFPSLKPKTIIFIGIILLILFLLWLKLTAKPVSEPAFSPPSPAGKPQTPGFPLPEDTSPAPGSAPAAERGDPTYYEEIGQQLNQRFPLYRFLPLETEDYAIKYLGPLKLEISLKSGLPAAKTEAWQWIESKGVATQSHEIIFK